MAQDQSDVPDTSTSTWIVDGLEGRYARVEVAVGQTLDMLLARGHEGVKEGDVLRVYEDGGDFTLEIDHAETARRRAGAQAQLDALNRAAPAGEIEL